MGEDEGRMAIGKWLWPKLENTEDADRELLFVARGFFLVVLGMMISLAFGYSTGQDVLKDVADPVILAFLAPIISSKRSRVAALVPALHSIANAVALLDAIMGAEGIGLPALIYCSTILPVEGYLSVRGVRGSFIFHRKAGTHVNLWRGCALSGITLVYLVASSLVAYAMFVVLGLSSADTDREVAVRIFVIVVLSISIGVPALAIGRVLPGTRRLGPIAEAEKPRFSPADGRFINGPWGNSKIGNASLGTYIARHWRGEFSLARSFWANYGLLYAAFFAVAWAVVVVEDFDSFRLYATIFAFLFGTQFIVFFWMLVGGWRAAGNHICRTGSRFWPWVARAALVIHAMALVVLVAPNVALMTVIGAGFDPFNKFRIVRTGSKELMVQGFIGSNLPGEISGLLDAAPEIEWIRLESAGGRIGAAREFARAIGDRGLKVRVWDECSSACFVAFMAADLRAASRHAKIGLHAYSPATEIGPSPGVEMKIDRRHMIARGVPEAFLDKAFSTPPDDMWYPSFEELVEAGVVTHVMEGGETRPVRPE